MRYGVTKFEAFELAYADFTPRRVNFCYQAIGYQAIALKYPVAGVISRYRDFATTDIQS
jgi:hypothetical protein